MSGEVETRARELGWVPQEEFRGDTAKWIDAETFVSRGEQMLPLLRKHNKDLEGQVQRLNGELTNFKTLFEESQQAIKDLKEFSTAETKRQVEDARRELRSQLIAARESGDHNAELDIQEQLDDIRDAQRAAPEPAKPPTPAPAPVDPAVQAAEQTWVAWHKEKAPWWNVDKKRTAMMTAIAAELREAGEKSTGVDFYDKTLEKVNEFFDDSSSPRQKVEGAGGGGGGGNGSSSSRHTYDGLPADAKAACNSMEKKLVGQGKAFKTQAEWRNHYVEQYHAGE